ncbi:MAG: peptide-N4-asparagine amidase [Rhodanobacter sp.]
MIAGHVMVRRWSPVVAVVWTVCASLASASGLTPDSAPRLVIGSPVAASAEPPVSRPATTACTVTLLDRQTFDERGDAASMSARPHEFDFAPPMVCPGSWGKVVLEVDFSVPAGRQFDRTVALWLGGINLYFGTTIEPSPDVAQHWHVERDLTDYASLFTHAQVGQMILNNQVSPTTNSPIFVSARLKFYPAGIKPPVTAAADHVYALSSGSRGEQSPLATPDGSVSRRLAFPRNVERAYLDVIAQSQSHDERWYTCVDKAYLEKTRAYSLEGFEACDGGSFRGVEVLLDGQPAGLAPVYPWIYTGGIAPHLWLPTPGIQTVNFIPFRVDLTPFAGLLDDSQPHTVSVRVLGADHFFSVAANLLVYQDHRSRQLSGSVVRNTLARQQPADLVVRDTLHVGHKGGSEGTVNTDQMQSYVITGRLQTSRGTIDTTVRYQGSFRNHQTFRQPAARRYVETIDQLTTVSLAVDRSMDGHPLDGYTLEQHDPLYLSVDKSVVTKGQDFTALVAMRQGHEINRRQTDVQGTVYHASLRESLSTRDRADGKAIPDPLDRTDFAYREQGTEQVSFVDSFGSCYRADMASRDERLSRFNEGQRCLGHVNHLDSRSRPDSPSLAPL